ncbi:hypothetical protein BDV95DRAFT_326334 [Massariosphaeria phaeospora]|uniref:Uncharacterized protein n=1 Tax=Massariosphaeria phaeospora TaxID=100035 RepID=A0A7C8MIK3_9PLEO|nr:hypothetical protein BDV95DRAFT_326334 [Massariosphaeria phaeospora]
MNILSLSRTTSPLSLTVAKESKPSKARTVTAPCPVAPTSGSLPLVGYPMQALPSDMPWSILPPANTTPREDILSVVVGEVKMNIGRHSCNRQLGVWSSIVRLLEGPSVSQVMDSDRLSHSRTKAIGRSSNKQSIRAHTRELCEKPRGRRGVLPPSKRQPRLLYIYVAQCKLLGPSFPTQHPARQSPSKGLDLFDRSH